MLKFTHRSVLRLFYLILSLTFQYIFKLCVLLPAAIISIRPSASRSATWISSQAIPFSSIHCADHLLSLDNVYNLTPCLPSAFGLLHPVKSWSYPNPKKSAAINACPSFKRTIYDLPVTVLTVQHQ